MKKTYKAVLCVIFGLAGVAAVRADSGGDLLVGFTQSGQNSTGNDLYYDLGAASSLTNGQTWNLNSLLAAQGFTLNQLQWGVVGDYVNGGTATIKTALTWYSDSKTPNAIDGNQIWKEFQAPINSIAQSVLHETANTGSPNTSGADIYSDQNSWYSETIDPTLGTQLYNVTGADPINVTGTNSPNMLWQIIDNNSSPTNTGSFILSSSGVLKFNIVTVLTNLPPQPRIVSVTRSSPTTTIYFTTTNGTFTYTLYFTNSAGLLASVTNWPASSTTVTGNGLTNNLSDTTTATNRFYRIGVH
jgi:hypothetical protein